MRPPKPRASAEADATYATIAWDSVPGATYYRVVFRGVQYNVSDGGSSIVLRDLHPSTEYTANVTTVIVTEESAVAVVHFRTTDLDILVNAGSGSSLYSRGTGPYELSRTTAGYEFDPGKPGLLLGDTPHQFATFEIGELPPSSNVSVRLTGSTLNSLPPVLLVKVGDATGWLDARRRHMPGIADLADGGRVQDRVEGGVVRLTFNGVRCTGRVAVKVGLDGPGSLAGAELVL